MSDLEKKADLEKNAELEKMADAVSKRAEELLPKETRPELDLVFIRQCLEANERGDGVMFATLFKDLFRQNVTPKDDEWYSWDGTVWTPDYYRSAINAVEECALEYQRASDTLKAEIKDEGIAKNGDGSWKIDLKKRYDRRVNRLRSKTGATSALFWAPIIDRYMACREEDFNKQHWLLPVNNGVINLQNGALTNGDPADLMTRKLDIDYNPHADYSLWEKTLMEICGNEKVVAFLKRVFGYAATGFSHEQYFFVFIGPGRNGKGVLFSLIGKVMGPFYHEVRKAMILKQRHEPPPSAATEHLYSLMAKRILVGAETNKGEKIDEAAIKALTGEDMITCRPNFKSEISFDPTHTLFLHTNHIPVGLTSDFAMRQRMFLIDFPFMFVDDVVAEKIKHPAMAGMFRQKNPKLKEELMQPQHLQGILRWLVEGAREWQELGGLAPPQEIIDAVDKLAVEEDSMGQFIKDCLVLLPEDEKSRVSCKSMHSTLEWWWGENMDSKDKRIPSIQTMNKTLRQRGFTVEKKGGITHVYGVMLNPEITKKFKKDKNDA